MLLVQEYLQNHSFKQLEDEHGVFATFSQCRKFFSLNYDQILAKEGDSLSQQCRGLILCKTNYEEFTPQLIDNKESFGHIVPGKTLRLNTPFFRFLNYGQGYAAEIDWNDPNLKILSKEDGTCIMVWYNLFTQTWNVATRSIPEANVPLDDGKFTFRTLFEHVLSKNYNLTFEQLTDRLDTNITYVFELCSLYNRIVVEYPESKIFFLGARNNLTLQEYDSSDPIIFEQINCVNKIREYSFNNINDIVNWVSEQNPLHHEGVVVRDSQFNRIKVKNAQYVAFSRAKDNLSSNRNCLRLILSGKEDDILPAIPQEMADNIIKMKQAYSQFILEQNTLYMKMLAEADCLLSKNKKNFALALQKNNVPFSAAFYSIFDGKSENVNHFIMLNKKEGTWSDVFVDKILNCINF